MAVITCALMRPSIEPLPNRCTNASAAFCVASSMRDGSRASISFQIVSTDHITPLNIFYRDALACLEQSGRGLPKLLARSSFEKQQHE
jgi:hypothetical protein